MSYWPTAGCFSSDSSFEVLGLSGAMENFGPSFPIVFLVWYDPGPGTRNFSLASLKLLENLI